MSPSRWITVDGNEAVASVAYRTNEVIALYPITPSSSMGELADQWSVSRRPNLWGAVPEVVEMQSEGGAAGAVHGCLQAGALSTTFTSSQGLLLMIPNLYRIAGELTPFTLHVAARTVATHALSIFGDHSDVMAARQTGLAMLASGSVQETHDFAAVAQAATLASRIPFLHFFDGFRTSHEIARIAELADDDLRALLDDEDVAAHRGRALTPDRPVLRGTAQNPDTFFQAREAANRFYDACPATVQATFDRLAARCGRSYRLFDYHGDPLAERVVVLMGSGAETVHETVDWLVGRGERVGVLKVRLFRPFSVAAFAAALPPTVRSLAVLDRTKEPGAVGDPLFLDVVAALRRAADEGLAPWAAGVRVLAGRYGLSSKEFDPACVAAVFRELAEEEPRGHFTVGIVDDVTGLSLPLDRDLDLEPEGRLRALFFGLGSDGTVGANKSTIKIVGDETGRPVQGYFVYDSKKAGAVTVSHLRFGSEPIRSAYLIRQADFVACHQFSLLERLEIVEHARRGAVVLLNAPLAPGEVWDRLPREVQETVLERDLELYSIDAHAVAAEAGLGGRINTVMQVCFFALSQALELERALPVLRESIRKTYGRRGEEVVRRNLAAVEATLDRLHRVPRPGTVTAARRRPPPVPDEAPDFVRRVSAMMLAGKGDLLPVSAFPVDGTWPVGTSRWEKRNLALEIPVWEPDLCIQCNQCALACPHAAIRPKVYDGELLRDVPDGFRSTAYRAPDLRGLTYTLQVAPEDCTGCRLCVEVCPAKDRSQPGRKALAMQPQPPLREQERQCYEFFLALPELARDRPTRLDAKGSQFLQPLFEYSGACPGCGETPYVKLLSQLFGDRLLVANATGCSSIYGGNLPTTPYTTDAQGRGPAWSNSLFEDNAEFGLGFRLAVDSHARQARALLSKLEGEVGTELTRALLDEPVEGEAALARQRARVTELRRRLGALGSEAAGRLALLADYLVPKSVWLVGGDGWAYDIGYGGLDHVLALGRKVNVLVLDTEVYSNTGGQQSKATPLGAAAKFASAGKETAKKDLGLEAMSHGHVYVARVAFGAKMNQTVQALREAEAYPGPSLVIAYSPCVAHGYDLSQGARHQELLVTSGIWPLYRFDPRRAALGQPPLQLDSGPPEVPLSDVLEAEPRFRTVETEHPERFRQLSARLGRHVERQLAIYRQLAGLTLPAAGAPEDVRPTA